MEFEKKIKELENIVEKMGSGELSLQDSLKFFEKGIRLSRECSEQLNKSEEKVQQLIDISPEGKAITKDFEEEKT
ncbi:MAG: exodeoxyribonuclease VII small subunit [Oligoflexia bacterium]|nr:exodeoxyribonuclease VII small subunit [Bdellovibrionales bacterium]MYE07774.1 exodeoxyribonuclease VII small subunit [Oligoflexia bacterium]